MTFWCSAITVPHHYCAVLPTGKMVVQNKMLLYSLPINQETIERSKYKHYFKCSPGKLWGMGGTKQSMATKNWKLIKCDLLGFTFLSLLPFPASINCNVEQGYRQCITESQGYFSNWWQANQLSGECTTTVQNPLHFGVTSDGAFKLVKLVDFTPEKSYWCSFSGTWQIFLQTP